MVRAAKRWLELQEKRLTLQREADALEREQKLQLEICGERLQLATAGELKTLPEEDLGGGLRIFLKRGTAFIRWKDEVIRLKGAEFVSKVEKDAPRPLKVCVEKKK